jgi:hypothetical protein
MVLVAFQYRSAAQKTPPTEKDILPIVQRCFQCHGEGLQMSGLDLHTRAGMLKGGATGPAIIPGDGAGSLIMKRVTGQVQPAMPMKPVPPLTAQEIATLKDWIDQGAKWEEASSSAPAVPAPAVANYSPAAYKEKEFTEADRKWWAFQKPIRQPAPQVSDSRWSGNPIDAFVRDMMEKKGLVPAPEADRRTLIRRAYLDVLGLLPPVQVGRPPAGIAALW